MKNYMNDLNASAMRYVFFSNLTVIESAISPGIKLSVKFIIESLSTTEIQGRSDSSVQLGIN